MQAAPGVYFLVEGGCVLVKASRRADLQIDRMRLDQRRSEELARSIPADPSKPRRSIDLTVLGVIVTPSWSSALKLRHVLERFWSARRQLGQGQGLLLTQDDISTTLRHFAQRFGLQCVGATTVEKPAKRLRGPGQPSTVRRYVPDPSMSKAELLHQIDLNPGKKRIGQIKADVKLETLLGGVARLGNITEAQTLAAAQFKTLHEKAQLGGAKAIDYSAVKVDTSGGSVNSVLDIGEQARIDLAAAKAALGVTRTGLIEQVVIYGDTVSRIARKRGVGTGGAARSRVTGEVLEAVDVLANHFGYAGAGKGKGEITKWADRPRLPLVDQSNQEV